MARSEFTVRYSSVEKAENAIESILMSNKFMEINYYGETVWKRYHDFLGETTLLYLKTEFDNQYVHISAWIGCYEGIRAEVGLDGFAGIFLPKRKLQKIVEELKAAIQEG